MLFLLNVDMFKISIHFWISDKKKTILLVKYMNMAYAHMYQFN